MEVLHSVMLFVLSQGSVTVGLKSRTHVVLVALKRSTSELSSYQKKILPIDDHVGAAIAGLTSDGRMLGYVCACEWGGGGGGILGWRGGLGWGVGERGKMLGGNRKHSM